MCKKRIVYAAVPVDVAPAALLIDDDLVKIKYLGLRDYDTYIGPTGTEHGFGLLRMVGYISSVDLSAYLTITEDGSPAFEVV